MRNVQVAAAVAEAQLARMKALEMTVERLDREAGCIATSYLRRIVKDGALLRLEDIPDELAPAISSIEVITTDVGHGQVEQLAKIRLWDKNKALDLLYRRQGKLTDNTTVNLKGESDVTRARIAKEVSRMSTEDLRLYDTLERQQEELLQKALGANV